MSNPVLRIDGLRKSFGTNTVLEGITLSVMKNEVVCLIGASGSGKSTLLRCVNLLERVDAGSIYLDGALITGRGVDQNLVRKHIGIVFQSYNLFPHMTVERNVTLGPCKALGMTRAEAAAESRILLERFGLAGKRNDYPDRLSGGQQQRVAIVRALAMKPRLLLLDEVTSALDPELVAEVLDVIRELAEGGMTMVIATHEMGFAREIASRVCFLEDGQIVEEAPPAQLFSAPADERTQRFLRRITDARRLLCTRGRLAPTAAAEPQTALRAAPRGPGAGGRRCGRSCAPRWAARRCCSARPWPRWSGRTSASRRITASGRPTCPPWWGITGCPWTCTRS
jgi:polar amino acid transport system ATP-binding protein